MSNNLNLFADATIQGGTYDKIKVFGSADVLGDLEAKSMKIFGSSNFQGKCKINTLQVYGESEFKNFVEVNYLNIKGDCVFEDDVKVEKLKIFGFVKFNETVFRSEDVKIYGDVRAKVLEADDIYIKGSINCEEQLNGENIEINFNGRSIIKEIVGTNIIVKPNNKFFSFNIKKMEIEVIEGDDIYLENVVAKVVRGNKVKIGPNCDIELIEYHESCDIKDKKGVKKVEKY